MYEKNHGDTSTIEIRRTIRVIVACGGMKKCPRRTCDFLVPKMTVAAVLTVRTAATPVFRRGRRLSMLAATTLGLANPRRRPVVRLETGYA